MPVKNSRKEGQREKLGFQAGEMSTENRRGGQHARLLRETARTEILFHFGFLDQVCLSPRQKLPKHMPEKMSVLELLFARRSPVKSLVTVPRCM